MLLFPLAALAGAASATVRGGRLGGLAAARLRAPGLVWVAVAIQAWLGATGSLAWPLGGRFPILVATYVAVGAWLIVNATADVRLRVAFGLLALGWLLNLAAIIPNGGMPVSLHATAASGMAAGIRVDQGHLGKHVEATSSTALPWLGDVLPAPALDSVLSVGDLVMCAGVAIGVSRSMLHPVDPPTSCSERAGPGSAPTAGPGQGSRPLALG